MAIKPIPAFYCCYLLRSCVRHASLYIGSTPNPARRLAQHNGKVKGGAVRTSRLSLRPWEMTCIVSGFRSNIAALQFEWAWNNAHLTRHIPSAERISFATTRSKTSSRTGKTRRRPGRPRTSLIDRLSNLHLLLRVPYFANWGLEVRFFNEEVYRTWQTWLDRVDARIRPGIKVVLDLPKPQYDSGEITSAQPSAKRRKLDLIGNGGVEGVDPTYAQLQDVLEKGKFILDDDENFECQICRQPLDRRGVFTVCPHNNCRSLSHVECLSEKFLRGKDPEKAVIPESGKCAKCKKETRWADLMQEVSLRLRGEKEINKLLSKRQRTKAATAVEILDSESEEDDEKEAEPEAYLFTSMPFDESDLSDASDGRPVETDLSDESDDSDSKSVASSDSHSTTMSRLISATSPGDLRKKILRAVIEDSEENDDDSDSLV